MKWLTSFERNFNVRPTSPTKGLGSIPAASTTAYGVDPPRLSQYQATQSPLDFEHYIRPEVVCDPQRRTTAEHQASTLDTTNEAMLSIAGEENNEDENGQLFARPLKRRGTPRYLPYSRDRIPVEARSPSPASSRSLADYNSSPYPSPHTPSVLIEPSVLPPTQEVTSPKVDSSSKPTCSLNLMCYRSGRQGCIRRQIRVASKTRWAASIPDIPKEFWDEKLDMICNDQQFFHALHQEYEQHIRGFWRRYLSLKTLRQIRLLSYTPTTRPEVVPMDDFTLQEVFYAYRHPESIKTELE